MKRLIAALTAAALTAPAAARAQVPVDICGPVAAGPYAFVRVGDVCTNLSGLITLNTVTGLFNLTVRQLTVGAGLINTLDVVYDQDPSIDFGVNTSNLLFNQTSYAFYFGTPIDPGQYRRAASTGGVNVTRTLQDAAVSQDGGSRFITVYGSDGDDLIPIGVNIGTGTCSAGALSNTCLYPQPAGGPRSNQFAPRFFDNLEVELVYAQDGEASNADWNGRAEIFATSVTPEPTSLALVAAGGALLVGGARRRSRR